MDDLHNKIEELKKGLLSLKSNSNSLVPAIKPPSPKPLSMPAVKASAPIELPGVAPTSNKDPKKMAEQLKNPRPKKPKIDIMKNEEQHYALHVDGQRVGDYAPMKHHMQSASTMNAIKSPNVKLLPKSSAKPVKIAKNGQWSMDEDC